MTSIATDQGSRQFDVQHTDRELVVLIHGLAAGRAMMRPLESRLLQAGFETLNWGYRSIIGDIGRLGRSLAELLQQLDGRDSLDRIHLVTHSMGSIIARAALAESESQRLSRVVMLGPPNGGSPVATRLAPALGWFCKPLKQLSDRQGSFVRSLSQPSGHEIDIIAAAYDRVVRMEDTTLSTQSDHVIVRSGHTSMLFRHEVAELVESFLRTGKFRRETNCDAFSRIPAFDRAVTACLDLAPNSTPE